MCESAFVVACHCTLLSCGGFETKRINYTSNVGNQRRRKIIIKIRGAIKIYTAYKYPATNNG